MSDQPSRFINTTAQRMPIDFAFAANALRWEAEMQPGNEVLDVTIWHTLEHHILNVRFLNSIVGMALEGQVVVLTGFGLQLRILMDVNGTARADGVPMSALENQVIMNAGFIFGSDFGLLRADVGSSAPAPSSQDLKKRLFRISYRGMLDRPSMNALQLASEAIARLSFEDKIKVLRGLVFLRVHTHNNALRLPLFLGEAC